jgi:polar amino acid transport system substrate-binding protein
VPSRSLSFVATFVCAALCCVAGLRAQTAKDLFLPEFWDQKNRMEAPAPDTIRVIRFLTDDDYPPFHFALADGSLAGFNVDLARAICEELKVVCSIQPRRWDTLVEAVADGHGDAAIASLSITESARAKVDFTAPYYRTPARFVARKTAHIEAALPNALRGQRVGVEARSAHEAYLRQFFPAVRVVPYESGVGMRAALRAGNLDAIFGDGIALALWLAGADSAACCAFVGGSYTESRYFGEGAGIAVRKDNPALREAIDYALQRVSEKGLYAELYLKYFPIGFY